MLPNLQIGDVILLGKQYSVKHLFSKKALKYAYEQAILFYQRDRFGDVRYIDTTHTLIYCGGDLFFEVTEPKAKFTGLVNLENHIADTGRAVYVLRYNRYAFVQADSVALNEIISPMIGKPYAYLDILPFILEKVIGFLPNAYKLVTDLFGGSWKKYMFKLIAGTNNVFLCSTGIAAIYVAMHKRNDAFPRPFALGNGDNEYVEQVTPAHFGCWPGDFTEITP